MGLVHKYNKKINLTIIKYLKKKIKFNLKTQLIVLQNYENQLF